MREESEIRNSSIQVEIETTMDEMKGRLVPSISIVIVTYNCARNLKECLSRISKQDYPKDKIEILVVDGGSTDETLKVAKSFGAKVVQGGFTENAEARRGIALLHAKNDIVAYIDSDIFLPSSLWLKEMVMPLMENHKIVATQPLQYEYRRTDSILNRYFTLFGVHDPVAYYLNKRDRFAIGENHWNLFGKAVDKGGYYEVKFNCYSLPPLGCNGFIVRKETILPDALPDPKNVEFFTHSDAVYDMVKNGHDTFGFVKNTVIHLTSSGFILAWMKKRLVTTSYLYFRETPPRKYKVYDPKNMRDNFNLLKYIVYTLTIVKPLYDSFRGFLKVRDIAWFMHPIMCFAMLYTNAYLTLRHFFKKYCIKTV